MDTSLFGGNALKSQGDQLEISTLFNETFLEPRADNVQWLISSDKIFSSDIENYTNYAPLSHIEYVIYKAYLGTSRDSTFFAKAVKIYMDSGIHCATLQDNMSSSKIMDNINIVKLIDSNEKKVAVENKTFKQCVICSFGVKDSMIGFSFSYMEKTECYTQMKKDGSQQGTASVSINLGNSKS